MDRVGLRVPKQVIIEATSACNLQCKYCPNVTGEYPVGNMSLGLFKHICDLVKKEMPDSVVIPWMNGEPFMDPNYLDKIKYISKLGLRFYVTTNLTIWRPDIIEYLLSDECTCYQIIVSMDGLPDSQNIYNARPGTNSAQLLNNLTRVFELKKKMNSSKDLAVKICERGQDWQEIEEYVQYWLDEDMIDYVCVGKPLKDENEGTVTMRRYPCQYFDRNFMVIRWDGRLVPCAYNTKVANQGLLTYGFVDQHTESLLNIYNNDFMQKLRWDQRHGLFPKPCDTCGFAYTGFGFEGEVQFRSSTDKYYFHQDYYNMFFSNKKSWKPRDYYFQEED